jgi:hypothetical protein
MAGYARALVVLDDTCDVVHGHQQLSRFNARDDERCFLSIHVKASPPPRISGIGCAPDSIGFPACNYPAVMTALIDDTASPSSAQC